MEDLILAGMSIPLTPWTVVHGDKLVPLLDRIRENLPDEIRQAQRVVEHRDDMLAEAQRKAAQMIQDAKEQAEAMLCESELLRAVHVEADRIRQQVWTELEAMRKKAWEEAESVKAQAYEEARSVREGADQYADAILTSLDKSLVEFQAVVRNGQKHLKRAKAEASHQAQMALGHAKGRSAANPHKAPMSDNPNSHLVLAAQELLQQSKAGV
jgi:F0F1-type ATP synthase membrane subunit b/b'